MHRTQSDQFLDLKVLHAVLTLYTVSHDTYTKYNVGLLQTAIDLAHTP